MDKIFIVLSLIILIQSILALGAALRFTRYALTSRGSRLNRYQPKVVIIVPCKGLDHEFEENIRAFLVQDYRDYEVIFVTESESDPAYTTLARLIKQSRRAAWMVVAGEARGCGQKVHNLCAALEMLNSIDRRAEVLVFADSDARPSRVWLSELVRPLGDLRIGATTGFRWYIPSRGSISSILLSVWNSSALSLLGERSSFAWGGSMAVRRENFEKLGIKQRWQGALSDDYTLTAAIREAGQRIKFVPQCLVASHADSSFNDLLEFTTRQMKITRVYSPQVWKTACVTHSLYNIVVWGGLVWLTLDAIFGSINRALALILLAIFSLGAMTGIVRAFAATHLLKAGRERLQNFLWAYAGFGPLISIVYLCNILASMRTKRIVWRGIGYDMISPTETLIWHRPAPRGSNDSALRSARRREASVRSSTQK